MFIAVILAQLEGKGLEEGAATFIEFMQRRSAGFWLPRGMQETSIDARLPGGWAAMESGGIHREPHQHWQTQPRVGSLLGATR